MARVRLGLIALVTCGACDSGEVRRIGSTDPAELRTPTRVAGNDLVVPGCCSFALSGRAARRLGSDSLLYEVDLPGGRMTITFGAHDSAAPGPGYRRAGARRSDGIEVRAFERGAGALLWTARVPPSAVGEARRLQPFGLRIEASCASEAGCAEARRIAGSLRF